MDKTILAQCQTCLGSLEVSINLFEPSYKNLLDVLQCLLTFQVYIDGRTFNICHSCQKKLTWIVDFQIVCLKSVGSLRNHSVDNESGVENVDIKLERSNSNSPVECLNQINSDTSIKLRCDKLKKTFSKNASEEVAQTSQNHIIESRDFLFDIRNDFCSADFHFLATTKATIKKRIRNRYDHYPVDHVLKALADCRSYMTDINKLKCIFCDYTAKTSRILSVHVHSTHNSSVNTWCARCNLQTEDLRVHLNITKCTENRCVFCKKVFSRINALTEHLKLHSSSSKMDDNHGLSEVRGLKNTNLTSKNHFNKSAVVADEGLLLSLGLKSKNISAETDQLLFCNDNSDSMSDYEIQNNNKDTVGCSAQNNMQLKSRNKQFPFSEVLKAIKEVNSFRKEMKNRRCIFCSFVGGNAIALRKHMNTSHKEVINWCKHCNIETDDLHNHQNTMRCDISQCTFCRKSFIFKKLYKFKDHLKTHCGKFVEEIESTYYKNTKVKLKQFAAREILRAIEETRCKTVKASLRKICQFCGDSFTKLIYLRRHLRQHCRKELCRAKTSDVLKPKLKRYKQFAKNRVLQAINDCKSYKTDAKRLKCLHCDYTAISTRGLLFHMRGLHNCSVMNWCRRCNLQTDNLQQHVDTVKCSESKCVFCKKSFNRNDKLIVHLKLHNITRSYENNDLTNESMNDFQNSDGQCMVCTKYFCNLKMHMVRKHNMPHKVAKKSSTEVKSAEEKHLCPICGKIFKTSSGVNYHVSSHYRDSKFKCSICGKCFFNRNVLRAHEKQHSDAKAFVCHICGKGSTHKATHLRHLETHEVGPVQCKICQKQFYRPGVLKLHMRHHTGENDYHCIPCGKSFHIKSLLRLHMEMHNDDDDRRYICAVCGKGFKGRETLRRHKHIHTGVKRYKCSVCPFRSVQAQGLTTHMKQHPEDAPLANKPHKCVLCHRSFSTNALLMSHTDNCHSNDSKNDNK